MAVQADAVADPAHRARDAHQSEGVDDDGERDHHRAESEVQKHVHGVFPADIMRA
ncbi:hypothetical protein D3C72_2381510 [compost metagenome]